MEKYFLEQLFKINHVMLSNQAVSPILFHLILFLSFAQILFNIFYKVNIFSEFTGVSMMDIASTTQNGTIQTEIQKNNSSGMQDVFLYNLILYRSRSTSVQDRRILLIHQFLILRDVRGYKG